jgi:hypothetical protein
MSFVFFLHLLIPINFRSFSIQSNHLNFGLAALIFPSGFPRNTFFMVLSSSVLTRWPAHSNLHTFIVVTLFCFFYVTCNSSLVQILQPFWSFTGLYVFLSIFCSHVFRDDLICSVVTHVSQPCNTIKFVLCVFIYIYIYILMIMIVNALNLFVAVYKNLKNKDFLKADVQWTSASMWMLVCTINSHSYRICGLIAWWPHMIHAWDGNQLLMLVILV